jgi:uncharacterized protein YebE (UPF0316 family)
MNWNELFYVDPDTFNWIVLPLLVFLARVCDVTIGTVRSLLVSRRHRILVPILGFLEMLVWLLAVRQVVFNLTNWVCYVAFAGGFAVGNIVGMRLEERLAVGVQVIRIITHKEAKDLIECLQNAGYGVTTLDAQGRSGKVSVIFTIVKRSEQKKVISIIEQFNPQAFYSIEDISAAKDSGFLSSQDRSRGQRFLKKK